MMPKIELVFFEGCPNVEQTRQHIQAALHQVGAALSWEEWDTLKDTTPAALRRYGSPTVLVEGKDVTGAPPGNGMRCVVGGAPAVELIVAALGQGQG